jgi:hypothetical protein
VKMLTAIRWSSKKELIDGSGQRCLGRAVRMLELLTLNQRVQGSSPCAPTNHSIVQPGDMGNGTYLRHG